MTILTFIPLLSSLLVISLGSIVFYIKPNSKINILFFLHSISIFIWLFASFMMNINRDNYSSIIFWDKIVYSSVVFLPALLYHFGLEYRNKKNDITLRIAYTLSIIFLCLIPSKYFLNDVFYYQWGVHTIGGIIHHLFLLYFTIFVIIWFIKMIHFYSNIYNPIEKERTAYIIFGFFLLFGIGPIAYLPAYKISVFPIGFFSGLLFSIFISYAIVVKNIINIKFVLKKSFISIFSILFITIIGFIAYCISTNYFQKLQIWIIPIIILLTTYLHPIFKNKFSIIANKYFFTSFYNSQKVISDITKEIKNTLDIDKIYYSIYKNLLQAMHFKSFIILKYNKKDKFYYIDKSYKYTSASGKIKFKTDQVLEEAYVQKGKIINANEIKNDIELYKQTKKTIDIMNKEKIQILVPLNTSEKTIGLIALGSKESNDYYNSEDIKILEIISTNAAIAIDNAHLYKNLEQKVLDRTKKIKNLQEEQKQMMIDISHNLQTPLTVIKSELNDIKHSLPNPQILNNFDKSIDKVTSFIYNLLKLSELEKNQEKTTLKKINLSELVLEQAEYFQVIAENKNVKVLNDVKNGIYIQGIKSKLEDLMTNLVSNSIKYIGNGNKIIISLIKNENNKIILSVKDNGIGIDKKDQEKIFQRFNRIKSKETSNIKGTGLGLAIIKKIVDTHNAKIKVISEINKGTEFKITFN